MRIQHQRDLSRHTIYSLLAHFGSEHVLLYITSSGETHGMPDLIHLYGNVDVNGCVLFAPDIEHTSDLIQSNGVKGQKILEKTC